MLSIVVEAEHKMGGPPCPDDGKMITRPPISTIKSPTGPRFFYPCSLSGPCTATHYAQTTKNLCRCRNSPGLAKTELTPSLVPSLLGTKPHQRQQVAMGGESFPDVIPTSEGGHS